MSREFLTYGAIMLSAWLVALVIVRPRNALDFSRCVGWYLLVFLATYLVRPAASLLTGDTLLYKWLRIGSFEDHWYLMATAVPVAILSFAIAYAGTGMSAVERAGSQTTKEPAIEPRKVRMLIYFMIGLGYLSALISIKTGTLGGDPGDYEGATVGVYEHNTAWFAQDDLFVSTGSILYYILTGRLGMSLLIAAPWLALRTVYGWGRSHLLGHFFALIPVYFLKSRRVEKSVKQSTQVLVILGAVLTVLIMFPLMGMLRVLKARLHMGSASLSADALGMMKNGADPADLVQTYMGVNSPVTGFETTLDHLINDNRSELGTQYLYYYFIKPVPRIVWPGKGTPYTWPQDLRGVEADPLLSIIGAAPGSIGMAYQQWGWLGIPFEFMLAGWLIRRAEEAARRRMALHIQLAYAGLYSTLPQLGRDSILYTIANVWLFKYGLVCFALWLMYSTAVERAISRRAQSIRPVSTAVPMSIPGR